MSNLHLICNMESQNGPGRYEFVASKLYPGILHCKSCFDGSPEGFNDHAANKVKAYCEKTA